MSVNRTLVRCLLGFPLFLGAASLYANAIDTLTLTPAGTNTNFVITGTYPAGLPANPFISAGTPYSLNFALPTEPTSFAFLDPVDGIFALDATISLNGITFHDSQVAFFASAAGGGLDACLDEICTPNPPTIFATWVVFGQQLFTGEVSTPFFTSGTATIDPRQSFIETPVPEPTALRLGGVGLGLIILVAYVRRKKTGFAKAYC
jgi:hypothetical protein